MYNICFQRGMASRELRKKRGAVTPTPKRKTDPNESMYPYISYNFSMLHKSLNYDCSCSYPVLDNTEYMKF